MGVGGLGGVPGTHAFLDSAQGHGGIARLVCMGAEGLGGGPLHAWLEAAGRGVGVVDGRRGLGTQRNRRPAMHWYLEDEGYNRWRCSCVVGGCRSEGGREDVGVVTAMVVVVVVVVVMGCLWYY